ncbi:hypothetical protein [Xylanimonas ulmi]|uniref:hypothetical protein n=1 Tax=Xylanimonas ulmi TaxID=228973 RepID=UPI00102AC19F|nr:hypothetical protein [Xylanibacterium ulmi]
MANADHAPGLRPMLNLTSLLERFESVAAIREVPRTGQTRLTRPHKIPLVEAWRQAALASVALVERELPTLRNLVGMPGMVASRDAAQIAVALLRLDGRYENLKGWKSFGEKPGVDEVVALWTAADLARGWPYGDPARESYGTVIDQMGYRHPLSLSPSPAATVLNEMRASNAHLDGRLPSVMLLRYVAKGHLAISERLRRLAFEAGQMTKSEELLQRAGAYGMIGKELLNVNSGIMTDDLPADDLARNHLLASANALRDIGAVTKAEMAALTDAMLDADRIVSDILIKALRTSWFFEETDELGWYNIGVIKKGFRRWEPMTPAGHPDLVEVARSLGRDQLPLAAEPSGARDRAWFAGEIERTEIVPPSDDVALDSQHPRQLLRDLQRQIYEPGYAEAMAEHEAMWAAERSSGGHEYEPPTAATGTVGPGL